MKPAMVLDITISINFLMFSIENSNFTQVNKSLLLRYTPEQVSKYKFLSNLLC